MNSTPDTVSQFYEKLNLSNIPALDGLRGVAVLLVVFFHFGLDLGYYPLPGNLGVLVFFVLSGFLITWLLLRENEKAGTISLKQFYIRRTLRIFPAFYAYWLFTVGARVVAHRSVPWEFALGALLYVSNYVFALDLHEPSFMVQTWSLASEEQFYLLWPLMFRTWRANLSRLSMVLAGIIGFVWFYRLVLRFHFGVGIDYLQYAFDCRMDALLTGCLLAVLLKRRRVDGIVRVLCVSKWAPLLTVGVLALTTRLSDGFGANYSQIIGFPVEEMTVAVLLIQLIVLSETGLWSWLNSAGMRFLGRISYSLYLYHNLSFRYLPGSLRVLVEGSNAIVKTIVGLAISITLASISYYLVERVFLRLKKKHEVNSKSAVQRVTPSSSDGAVGIPSSA